MIVGYWKDMLGKEKPIYRHRYPPVRKVKNMSRLGAVWVEFTPIQRVAFAAFFPNTVDYE